MRVAVIEPVTGKIILMGESDGKRYDGMWLKVAGEMYAANACYHAEDAEVVSARFKAMAEEMRALKDAQQKRMIETFHEFGVR